MFIGIDLTITSYDEETIDSRIRVSNDTKDLLDEYGMSPDILIKISEDGHIWEYICGGTEIPTSWTLVGGD